MTTPPPPGDPDEPAVRGRLRPLRETELTARQRQMWDELSAGPRGATAVRPEGFLTGPFDVLLRSPDVGRAVADLGSLLRYESALTPRLRELVILTVAARWQAAFAWLRHDVYARRAGLPSDAVEAIGAGRTPVFDQEEDRAAHAFVHQLVHTGAVSDEHYAAARAALGEERLVELVALTGYYCLSSMVLNAFEVPLPSGATVPWAAPDRPAGSTPAPPQPVTPASPGARLREEHR